MKALEIKTSMVFNFCNTILLCFFYFSKFFWLIILTLIPAVITKIFTVGTELAALTGIPIKEAKTEIETHPVIVAA